MVREELLAREPWIVDSLVKAFEAADAFCREEYEYPKRLFFPTAQLILEEEGRRFGRNPWQEGLAPNAHTLDKFMQYAAAQGYTPRVLSIPESFWPGTKPVAASERSRGHLVGAA